MIWRDSNERHQWIYDLVDAGFRLIPLLAPITKTPVDLNWTNLPPDPLQSPDEFPHNYGVVLHERVLVIDVDPRNNREGDDPLIRLFNLLDVEKPGIDTYTVHTGRGTGAHIYFSIPPGINIQTNVKGWEGLQFLSHGHMVVGPGSIHPDTGKPYTVKHGHPDHLLPAPQVLIDLCSRSTETIGEGIQEAIDDEGTIRRFILYLESREPAIQGHLGDELTFKTAITAKEMGLSQDRCYHLMSEHYNPKCVPSWTPDELRDKVSAGYRYSQNALGCKHPSLDFSENEEYERAEIEAETQAKILWDFKPGTNTKTLTLRNVKNFFVIPSIYPAQNPLYKLLRFNQFTQNIEFARPAPWHNEEETVSHWRDIDCHYLELYFSKEKCWNPPENMIYKAAKMDAQDNAYHPVRQYLHTLPRWDGIDRCGLLFSYYAGAEFSKYTESISIAFMIGMIARIMKPGCKFDSFPVLEGLTGKGKSTFCHVLGGKDSIGGDFYLDLNNIDPANKDTVQRIQGAWLIELSELSGVKRSDLESFKSFISCQIDKIRQPYDRLPLMLPRQCVFIGTTNETQYMVDITGNRRYWPVSTGHFRIEELKRDRDQLFAEALARFRRDEGYFLASVETQKLAEIEQSKRLEYEIWQDRIVEWLECEIRNGEMIPHISAETLASESLNIPSKNQNTNTYKRIGMAMRQIGWERKLIRENGKQRWMYVNPNYELADL